MMRGDFFPSRRLFNMGYLSGYKYNGQIYLSGYKYNDKYVYQDINLSCINIIDKYIYQDINISRINIVDFFNIILEFFMPVFIYFAKYHSILIHSEFYHTKYDISLTFLFFQEKYILLDIPPRLKNSSDIHIHLYIYICIYIHININFRETRIFRHHVGHTEGPPETFGSSEHYWV